MGLHWEEKIRLPRFFQAAEEWLANSLNRWMPRETVIIYQCGKGVNLFSLG
jgi:hypothetical protein